VSSQGNNDVKEIHINTAKSSNQQPPITPQKFQNPTKHIPWLFKDHLHFQVPSRPWICNI